MSLSPDVDIRIYTASGQRVHLPAGWITDVSFEIGERGGCLTGTITVVLEWQNFALTGTEYADIRLWGSPQVLYRGWLRQPQQELKTPETVTLSMFGLMTLLNGYQCRHDYTFAAADIGAVFTAVANDVVMRPGRWPALVLDTTNVAGLGITVNVLMANNNNFSDAMNALCDLAPGQLVWGCDVDSSGHNRLYLHPRADVLATSPVLSYPVGGKVTAFVYPRDANQVVNRIFVTGGKIQPPNVANTVNNPSFETFTQPGETTSNLLQNPGMETANGAAPTKPALWQAQNDPTIAQGFGHTGSNGINMDNNPTATEGISQMIPGIGAGVVLGQSCWVEAATGQVCKFYMQLTAYNAAGGAITTFSSPMITVDAGVVGGYVWQHYSQQWTTPAGTVAVLANYVLDGSSSGEANFDDFAVWSNQPTSDGWALGLTSGGYVAAVDWQHSLQDVPNSPAPFEPGAVMVKLQSVITGGAGSYVGITTTVDQRVSLNEYQTYTVAFRVAADTRGPALGVYAAARLWGSDKLLTTLPATPAVTSIPNDGAWHLVTFTFTATPISGTVPDAVDCILRFTSSGTYYIDAAQIVQGYIGGTTGQYLYTYDDTYRGTRDVTSSDVAPSLASDAAASITTWGERESQVNNDNVIDETTMAAYAISYFQAHATPAVQARLTVDGAVMPLPITSLVRLINLPNAPKPLPAAKVSYRIGNTITVDADLNNERPDQAMLLRRIQTSGIGGVPWP